MGVKTCASDAGGVASSLPFGACSGVLSLLKGLDSGFRRSHLHATLSEAKGLAVEARILRFVQSDRLWRPQ